MVKKTIKAIRNEMMAIGTFKQKDISNEAIIEVPYLSHDEAKKIVRTYQSKVAEVIEFKKVKEENLTKHDGNFIVRVYEGDERLSFEIICNDRPFDNRNAKAKVVKMPKVPETISFDLFSKAVEMPEKIKNNFGKTVADGKFTLENWQKKYSDWLEKSKPVEKTISFNTFVKHTNKDKNLVERFKMENNIDGLHTIKEWDEIFINWVPQNITFSEFARAKNLPKENVVLYNKDDNSDGLILPVEKWEKRYNRWLEFRKETTEKKTETTVFDGKVVYKNVEYLLTKQGKNIQDLKNCLPVNLVAKIIKSKSMKDITPKDAARLVTFLNTDVNFFLGRNTKVQYDDEVPTIENIQEEMGRIATNDNVVDQAFLATKTPTVEKLSKKSEKAAKVETSKEVATKNCVTVEPENVETSVDKTDTQSTEMLNEKETKEVLEQEKQVLVDRNSELLRKLISSFDVNAHLTLPEDFSFKQLAACMRDEQKDDSKIQSRDCILSSVFVDIDDCVRGEMSMDFVQGLKTIIDELYENQKTIEGYNV